MTTIFIKTFTRSLFFMLILFCLGTAPSQAQFYQGYQTEFGKNRVQYTEFLWTYYRFEKFDTYFYVGGMENALFVGRTAESHIEEIERMFDYRLDGRIQFILYNKLSDLKQSNIGLQEESSYNTGGYTRIVGNKVLLYFDGNHENLIRQMREGIAQVIIDQLMFGGDIKERLQNAVLLTLPGWYVQGLISYASVEWTVEMDNKLRDAILSGRFKKFNRLTGADGALAGHSLWRYVAATYGASSVSNLLYMSRVNRNIDSGFLFVLGVSLKNMSKNWLEYYQRQYFEADKGREQPVGDALVKRSKPEMIFSELRISPRGDKAAYVANHLGKFKVYVYDFKSGKRKRIYKQGYRSLSEKVDESVPLLQWHPNGRVLSIIQEKKGKILLSYYDLKKKKIENTQLFHMEKVLSFSYSHDGENIVMSGVQRGQSDIYVFNVRTRNYTQITNDMYDDLYPSYYSDSRGIVFSSNRVNDTLGLNNMVYLPPMNNMDLFIYDNTNKSNVLKRVTNTPMVNEIRPIATDSARFAYLSDDNGIFNRYVGSLDSVISYIDTTEHYRYVIHTMPQSNFARNVLSHDVNTMQTKQGLIMYKDGRYKMYVSPMAEVNRDEAINKVITPYRKQMMASIVISPKGNDSIATKPKSGTPVVKLVRVGGKSTDSTQVDIKNYVFQNEISRQKTRRNESKGELKPGPKAAAEDSLSNEEAIIPEVLPIQRNYDIAFEVDYLLSQLDNSLINSTYQTFTGGAFYFDPGLNGLFKVGVADLMGDYKMSGGVKISGDLTSNEYLLSFTNLKHRVDKSVVFYRQSRTTSSSFSFFRVHTHELKYINKYPFNNISALKATVSYRNDRRVFLATDIFNLVEPNISNHWASAKLEYVYDNTLNVGLNLYNGFRYKIFAEMFKEVDVPESNLYVLGADFRYYKKIHRQIVWANRLAASTSLGDRKLVYYMGSTDNALIPTRNFNNDINVDLSQNYVFQAVATNMRGFVQNIRNGNSFALINSELRIPVFQYIINRPIRSDFINNFQLIGFGDIGTAWTGPSPYSEDNSLNTQTIVQNPFVITITRQVEPIVAGYGFGARSRLLGYFIRGDWAWGVEDGDVQKPIFYLSLSLDF